MNLSGKAPKGRGSLVVSSITSIVSTLPARVIRLGSGVFFCDRAKWLSSFAWNSTLQLSKMSLEVS
jgi:hypothetical protein